MRSQTIMLVFIGLKVLYADINKNADALLNASNEVGRDVITKETSAPLTPPHPTPPPYFHVSSSELMTKLSYKHN